MNMREWSYPSPGGVFRIQEKKDGFELMIEGQALGRYDSAQQVIDNLLGARCEEPPGGYPERFDVPDDVGEWRLRMC